MDVQEQEGPSTSMSDDAPQSPTSGADDRQSRKERGRRKSNRESRRSTDRRRRNSHESPGNLATPTSDAEVFMDERGPDGPTESIEVSSQDIKGSDVAAEVEKRKSKPSPTDTSIQDGEEYPPDPPVPAGEHTWEQLEAIEKRRRDILLRSELGLWGTLRCVDGTVMTMIFEDPVFWIALVTYVAFRLLARYSQFSLDFVSGLADGNLATIGGFITFFLSLYVNNSHKRYFDQYGMCMACKGRILDVATLGATYLPKSVAHRIVRYMNAAHIQGYVGLSSTYSYPNFFVKMNKDFALLTARELERMNSIDIDKGGSCNRELIVWCLREIQTCHAQGIIDHELACEFRDHILRLRAAIGQIYDAADLPIPFFYVHFISLLAVLYMPLFAIAAAYKVGVGNDILWVADILVLLVVILQSIFVNGLRLLGQKMNDPFGDDLTDLSVIFYATFTWTMSNRILESAFVDTRERDESNIKQRQISLGGAWEQQKESA